MDLYEQCLLFSLCIPMTWGDWAPVINSCTDTYGTLNTALLPTYSRSHMAFRLSYLHLTLVKYKGQYECLDDDNVAS